MSRWSTVDGRRARRTITRFYVGVAGWSLAVDGGALLQAVEGELLQLSFDGL